MTTPNLRRRGKPNDLKSVAPGGYLAPRPGEVHDRKAEDKYGSLPVPVEIDDPYGLNFGDKIAVMRETRNDPLADMMSRGQLEESDYMAGRHWQNAHENSQIGSIRAIDPTREAVDGGRAPEMLTDRQRKGASDVDAARLALKPFGNALIQDVLSEGLSIRRAAMKRGMTSGRAQMALGAKFRECLSTMAVLFGLAMRPKIQRR